MKGRELAEAPLEGEIVENPRQRSVWGRKAGAGAIVTLIVVSISVIAWRSLRRMAAREEVKSNLGELGIDLPDFLTGKSKESGKTVDQFALASRQVTLARSGKRLTRAQEAEGYALFAGVPNTDRGAHIRSAYWLAVASRLVGSNDLGLAAQRALAKGAKLRSYSVAGNYLRGNVAQILGSNAAIIQASVEQKPDWATALAVPLQMLGQVVVEPSAAPGRAGVPGAGGEPGGALPMDPNAEPTVMTTVGQTLTGIFTGERPEGVSDGQWGVIKWTMRAGLVVGGVFAARGLWPSSPAQAAPDDGEPKANMGDVVRAFGKVYKHLGAL